MNLATATGTVSHARREHARHAFSHHLGWMLADLDDLQAGFRFGRLAGGDGCLLAIKPEDHLGGKRLPWRESLAPWLAQAGLPSPASLQLLTLPRMAGRVFNPASFWFGRDAGGALQWMIVEIDNTFGERHIVPLDARSKDPMAAEWMHPKTFPVSPFHDVSGDYHVVLRQDAGRLRIGIDLLRPGKPVFHSELDLRVEPVRGPGGIARCFLVGATTAATVPLILLHAAVLHLHRKVPAAEWPVERDRWTIRTGPQVLLQRIFAGRLLAPLWKLLASAREKSPTPTHGVRHGH